MPNQSDESDRRQDGLAPVYRNRSGNEVSGEACVADPTNSAKVGLSGMFEKYPHEYRKEGRQDATEQNISSLKQEEDSTDEKIDVKFNGDRCQLARRTECCNAPLMGKPCLIVRLPRSVFRSVGSPGNGCPRYCMA